MRVAAAENAVGFADKTGLPPDALARDIVPPLKQMAGDSSQQVRKSFAVLLDLVNLSFTSSFAQARMLFSFPFTCPVFQMTDQVLKVRGTVQVRAAFTAAALQLSPRCGGEGPPLLDTAMNLLKDRVRFYLSCCHGGAAFDCLV